MKQLKMISYSSDVTHSRSKAMLMELDAPGNLLYIIFFIKKMGFLKVSMCLMVHLQ